MCPLKEIVDAYLAEIGGINFQQLLSPKLDFLDIIVVSDECHVTRPFATAFYNLCHSFNVADKMYCYSNIVILTCLDQNRC